MTNKTLGHRLATLAITVAALILSLWTFIHCRWEIGSIPVHSSTGVVRIEEQHSWLQRFGIHSAPLRSLVIGQERYPGLKGEPPCNFSTNMYDLYVTENSGVSKVIVVDKLSPRTLVCNGPSTSFGATFGLRGASSGYTGTLVSESHDKIVIRRTVGSVNSVVVIDLANGSFVEQY